MKKKEFKELKEKSIKDLIKLAEDKKLEAVKKKMQVLAGKEKNHKVYRNLRSEIAKILILVREKQIMEKIKEGKSK